MSAFILISILTAAYFFEFRAALLIWIGTLIVNALLLRWNGIGSVDFAQILAGIITLFLAGTVMVYSRRTTRQLQRELRQRREIDLEIQRRNAELEALQKASLRLTSSLDLKLILETILENTSNLVHADDVHLFLYDGHQLTFGAALWEDRRQHQAYQQPRPEGATYTVARSGEALIIPDVDVHPLYANSKWGGAIASFPLSIGKQVHGVMNIAFRKPHAFHENDLRILRLFADQAAVALHNAQVYEAVRQQASDKERRVEERTAELLRANEHAEILFHNTFDAIVLFNTQGGIEQANLAFRTLFGLETTGVIQHSIMMLIHPDAREEFSAFVRSVKENSQPARLEITLRRPDGTNFIADVALALVPSQQASHPNVICSIRDISQRKQAEQREQMTILGLRTVLALANDLISCPDLDTTFRRAVEAARNDLGLERCGIFLERDGFMLGTYGTDSHGNTSDEHNLRLPIGETWRGRLERLKPKDAQWLVVEENMHTEWDGGQRQSVGKGWIVVTYIPFTDGSRAFMFNDTNITHTPLDETQQEIVAVYCSLLGKIIERKQAEESVRRALDKETELGEIKSRFITTISHEFRTPMAIIQSSAQLLRFYYERMDQEKKQEHLSKIEGQIQQMTSLLDNVLTISRAETVGLTCNPEPLDVIGFCRKIVEEVTLTTGATNTIDFSYKGDCSDCELDEKLLRQIVTNLLSNAVKYSPPGTPVQMKLACDLDQVVICVQDEGIGIPEEDQKHLFNDFHRAKNVGVISGTGLGLSIVQRAAAAHGGSVTFESVENSGTIFTVKLPTKSLITVNTQTLTP